MAGGLFNMELSGTGWVAILSDGPPVLLNVASAPTFADAQAAITWSSGVTVGLKTDFKMKNLIGRGSGESIQLAFSGQGWALVQPSEGRVVHGGRRASRRRARATCSTAEPLTKWMTSSPASRSSTVSSQVGHHQRASSAVPQRGVPQRLAAAGAARAPVGEQAQRAGELAAGVGELVDEARRPVGVRPRDDERVLGERLQPRAEDVGRDARRARPAAR